MDNIVEIILQAVDNASDVFASVTGSAENMGSSLQTAFEEATSEVERLEQELADIEMGNIEGDFDAVSQQLAEATAEAERLEQEMQSVDEATQQTGDDLGIINSSMLLQLSEQVGQLGSQAEGMAQEMNTAAISVGQLATQTGIAEPEMVSLINTISNATFPNDEAMMYVKSLDQMGVSASNLGQSATDIDKINDAFGLGAQTTNSLAQELGVLGVDMNNVSSSFNALAYANSNTVGGMQNYYSFLRKYDSQFKELGFDVDQSSIIIAAATQKYGGGRAALSGLSDALKESDGDVRKLEQALGIQNGTLDNASQVTGEYEGQLQALANEEAEHKTLLDQLGAAWEDLSLSLSGVLSPLSSVVGLIGSVGQFGLQVSGISQLISLTRSSISAIRDFNIVKTAQNLLEGEGVIASAAATLGITTEAAAAEGATVAFGGLAIAEGAVLWPILAIIAAIALFVAAVYEIGKAFGWWQDVGGMIDAIWSGINRLWEAFINHPDVQAVLQAIGDALSWIGNAIMGAITGILEFFGVATGGDFDIVRALIDSIGAAWNMVRGPIVMVINTIRSIITTIWDVVSGNTNAITAITNAWNLLVTNMPIILNALAGVVRTLFTMIWNTAVSLARQMVNRVTSTVRGLINGVRSALMSVVNAIRSAIQAWINAAVSKVRDLIQKVTSPFSNVASAIRNGLSGVASAITAPFQKAWQMVEPYVKKIKEGIDWISSAGGLFAGGEAAGYAGGPSESYSVSNEPVKVEQTLTLDFQNVPQHISTSQLIDALTDKTVLQALTSNSDFQSLDGKVKQRILMKGNRARGI